MFQILLAQNKRVEKTRYSDDDEFYFPASSNSGSTIVLLVIYLNISWDHELPNIVKINGFKIFHYDWRLHILLLENFLTVS